MATLNMKTKRPSFFPRITGSAPLHTSGTVQTGAPVTPGTVSPLYVQDGRLCPFIEITTPKGVLSLHPNDVARLRALLAAYDAGSVTLGPDGYFTADADKLVTP